jgi:tetratricopeptide (TPR) repeat protein
MRCCLSTLIILGWTLCASAMDPVKIRSVIRLTSMDMCAGVTVNDHKVGFAGETPLLYAKIQECRDQLKAQPNDMKTLRMLMHYTSQLRNPKQADEVCKTLIQAEEALVAANPSDSNAHQYLSTAYAQANRLADAEKAARKAMELDPKDPQAVMNLYYIKQKANATPQELDALLKQAEGLTTDEQIDLRISQTLIRAQVAQSKLQQTLHYKLAEKGGAIRLPAILEDDRTVAQAGFTKAVAEVDRVLNVASRKLKDPAGQCGLDTREKCLALLFLRDTILAMNESANDVKQVQQNYGAVIKADTAKIMRDLAPISLEDPTRLVAAFFVEFLSLPKMRGSVKQLPPEVEEIAAPYLKRFNELGQHKDPAIAATACYLLAFVDKIIDTKRPETQAALERAIKLYPDFEDARQMLLINHMDWKEYAQAIQVAKAWHEHSKNEHSLFCLAKSYVEADQWEKVRETVQEGLTKFPDSLHFQLAKIACDLREGDPATVAAKAREELIPIGKKLEVLKDQRLLLNYQLLCMVFALMQNDLPLAQRYGICPLMLEPDKKRQNTIAELLNPMLPNGSKQ